MMNFADNDSRAVDRLKMVFTTPFRARVEGKISTDFSFETVMRNLFRRLNMLSHFYCGKELDMVFGEWIDKAKEVRIVEEDMRFYDWERFSGRTQQRIMMGGFVGHIIFEGELGGFMPFLRLGEIVHIGKGCSFGMGKYKLEDKLH